MEKRIVVLGEISEFLIEFCKDLISRNLEVFLALKKNQELSMLKEIEGKVSLIKYNDEVDEIKFILKSIEPEIIYNLYGVNNKKELKELIEKVFLKNILLLEELRESNNSILINVIEKTERDEKGNPLSVYTAVIDSLNKVNKFYRDFYKIETSTTYIDEYKQALKI
ncbi:MAG: hypothetical protein HUJ77_06380 [Clostridium sp.]|uniref:hypothetical protein n=1 Tax=Clostridium sp. TaxID=1506 RepID=UPI0025BC67E8|nr:hypothetical protein [Clostridium sp.]MCF0148011.1 hypothetical protein [Clostridium sp.]